MEDIGVIIFVLAANTIINLVIIYWIIQSATRSNEQADTQRAILRLIVKQMQKDGHTNEDLNTMLNSHPALSLTDNP